MTALSRPQAADQSAPITGRRPRWPEPLSAVIAALMTFASLGGLFIDGLYGTTPGPLPPTGAPTWRRC
jgi:hypothetical protein